MSKKFTKAVLSAAMAGVLFGVSFDIMAAEEKEGEVFYSALKGTGGSGEVFKIFYNKNNKTAHIDWGRSGYVVKEQNKPIPLLSKIDGNGNVTITSADGSTTFTVYDKEVHDFMKAAASGKPDDIKKNLLTEQNIRDLYNRVSAIQQMETNVGLDEYGNVAVTPNEIKERVSLQRYLAWESANSTIVANELDAQKGKLDAQKGELEAQKKNLGELTTRTDKIDAAAAATAAKVESRTLVGVSSDGTLTRAEGAKNTISVNDGLVALSGRTDRIDAAVGAIDGRVTRNTQSIEKNSKAIAANTRTLQQHSARLDSQQRQINENHKEMKRAAAQSAALTGLFQPYSVGKFNATAAVGGYSDQQALAVGVGYRFNEQTAAKAGVAFSDGDASWNVGVNFEF
ncbi:YadA C-terminal domain-containing protein [Escherichia coli]|uniref:YadA C-terminal domain-containing protein n=1 Tax=Escherichia coli TaxID=562 RepID=UPI00248F659C|nr:YadA-like family protein [Escherichia coli]